MVDMETARASNKEYEDARKAYKQFLTPPPGTPSIWGPELQEHIEKGTFCPLTAMRQPNVDLDTYVAKSAYVKAKLHNAYPAKLMQAQGWSKATGTRCGASLLAAFTVHAQQLRLILAGTGVLGGQGCHAAPHVVPVCGKGGG